MSDNGRGRKSAIYGQAITGDGRGVPMTIDNNVGLIERAGVEPSRLDGAIDGLITLCEDGASMLATNGTVLAKLMTRVNAEAEKALARIEQLSAAEEQMTPEELAKIVPGINDQLGRSLDIVNKVTIVLDRVNKMLANAVKAKDIAIRLRTFIATGDELDTGLEGMSESQLRRIINATANGEMIPQVERRG